MLGTRGNSRLAIALLAATCLTPLVPARAAPGDAHGGEFLVNTFVTSNQVAPAVAMEADGDFVVAWASWIQDTSFGGIFAQRYDAAGVAQGPEFRVNTHTTGTQFLPAVAMDADGDFVVTWSSYGQDDPSDSLGMGVFAQRYDAAGAAQGPEFRVNTHTTGTQFLPAVAMDADGDFVVVWGSDGQDDSSWGVFAQRYDAAGAAQGPEFQVNSFTTGTQQDPAVAMAPDGDFVVVWNSRGQDSYLSDDDIYAQRFNAAGVAQGPEFRVNTFTTYHQVFPAVAMDADGDFVVAWSGYGTGDDNGIFVRRYDATGVAQGPEFHVNSFVTGAQARAVVAMDADGDFVVAWQSYGQDDPSDTFGMGVFAQRYDAAGAPQGGEFPVNTVTGNDQLRSAVATDADGDFVVAWDGRGPGDGAGVFARRYQGDGPVAGDFTVDGRSDILWRRSDTGSALLWQMDGFTKEASGSIGAPGTDWQLAGLADFDADSKTDILWRNTTTGNAVIWLMDGFAKLAAGGIGGASLDWEIVGTGDFDGDDHADILWRNTTTGAAQIWQMDGLSNTAAGGIAGPPPVWEVAGVGDFDADAKSDILWRHTTTGPAVVWLMDGFAKQASGTAGAPPPDWEVEGLGTFDSDARSDILWRNSATGNTVIWQMNGLAKQDAASIGTPPLVWRVEGVGDTDGDRQSDIIWRHTGNGSTLVWRMDGFVKDADGGIGSVPPVWEVQ